VGALAAGALTWVAARAAIRRSGAPAELVEAVASLAAAAILFWVSHWLVGRLQAERWVAFLRARVKESLGRGRLLALAIIAFVAVYREALESILFFEALLADRGGGAGWYALGGAGAGGLGLVAVVLLLRVAGKRLPMRAFFAVSGALLYALCVVLAGQGLHALRLAGVLEPRPVASPTVAWLGIYPDALGLAVQGVLVAAIAASLAAMTFRSRQGGVNDPVRS
jgi:high-affinity iron transporter